MHTLLCQHALTNGFKLSCSSFGQPVLPPPSLVIDEAVRTVAKWRSVLQDAVKLGKHVVALCSRPQQTARSSKAMAQPASGSAARQARALAAGIPVLLALDEAYHWLWYWVSGEQRAGERPSLRGHIPDPEVYFSSLVATDWPRLQQESHANPQARAQVSRCSADRDGASTDADLPCTPILHAAAAYAELQAPAIPSPANPLLRILQAHQLEATALFAGRPPIALSALRATGMGAQSGAASEEAATLKRGNPVCDNLLASWRDGMRAWPCRVYAYAVPSQRALELLALHAPLLEWGAGTGYWASLLRQMGVDIVALDSQPTAQGNNEYHGACGAWCNVHRGTIAQHMAGRTLVLCYPPPDSRMAEQALREYAGSTVCYVGEWEGDTGGRDFQHALLRGWWLSARTALPNWMDTAYELMVWHRRHEKAREVSAPDIPVASPRAGAAAACSIKPGATNVPKKRKRSLQPHDQDRGAVLGSQFSAAHVTADARPSVALAPVATECHMCSVVGTAKKLRRCRMTCAYAFCSEACLRSALAKKHGSDAAKSTLSARGAERSLAITCVASMNCYRCELRRRLCCVDADELHLADESAFCDLPVIACVGKRSSLAEARTCE